MRTTAVVLFLLAIACGSARSADWQRYEWYEPTVERVFVVDPLVSPLQYNHDSSIAWFSDRWFCLWNANTDPREGQPGQLNYMATSLDGRAWSEPVPVFASAEHSENPIPCPKGTQWQPNLIVVGGELWAVWSQNSRDDYKGCYVSRLRSPESKWRNTRLVWDGSPEPLIDGVRWRIFPSQNPYQLSSGRVLAPVTLTGPVAKDAPEDIGSWWAKEKRNSVLYSDDLGETWHCSAGTVLPGRSWAQWEPTVWEAADGRVLMVARNNDFRTASKGGPKPARMLTCSESGDQGETWSPHRFVPLETVASRMHVLPLDGDRKVMIHNDYPAGHFVADRRNLALFFTRGDGFDFMAGFGVTELENVVAYPQLWRQEDELMVSYSQGNQPRGIKAARITSLPRADTCYVVPRFRKLPRLAPERTDMGWSFHGGQTGRSPEALALEGEVVTLSARFRVARGGCLVDTRTTGQKGGFVAGLVAQAKGVSPFVFLNTPEHNIVADLTCERTGWNDLSIRIDRGKGVVRFELNGKDSESTFTTTDLPPFGGVPVVGGPALAGSRVPGLDAELVALAVGDGAGQGFELSEMVLPPARRQNHVAQLVAEKGQRLIRIVGDGSAGVELPDNERSRGDVVEIELRARVMQPGDMDVVTVGDANEHVSVGVRDGVFAVIQGETVTALGVDADSGWQAIRIVTGQGSTAVETGDRRVAVPHACEGNWVYLGKAYGLARPELEAWPAFEVGLDGLRVKVERAH
jgi:hypothetical protein